LVSALKSVGARFPLAISSTCKIILSMAVEIFFEITKLITIPARIEKMANTYNPLFA